MLLLLLLLACDTPGPSPRPVTDGTVPPCPTGEVDDGGTCVPEVCGTGTWGDVDVGEDTVFVAEGGTGDGTTAAPMGSIQAAADLVGARGGGLVAVAAGRYVEALRLGEAHDGVRLSGRCRDLVVLDGSATEEAPAMEVIGGRRRPTVSIAGLTVSGGTYTGLWAEGAAVTAVGTDFIGSASVGVLVLDAEVELDDVGVYGTLPDRRGDFGRGVDAEAGARVTITGGVLDGNADAALFATGGGTVVDLAGTELTDTVPSGDGEFGRGITVQDGARVTATGCRVHGNAAAGVHAAGDGTSLEVAAGEIAGTVPSRTGTTTVGLNVQEGAMLVLTGTTVQANAGGGIRVAGHGTTATLTDVIVLDSTADADGAGGQGITVQDGAALTGSGCVVDGNREAGIFAAGPGTAATFSDTVVGGTRASGTSAAGDGVDVWDGAAFVAADSSIEGNVQTGVYAAGPGTTVMLIRVEVFATAADEDGTGGDGIALWDGATLDAEASRVVGNTDVGVLATDVGTSATLRECTVADTLPSGDGSMGYGVLVRDGALVVLDRSDIAGNTALGIAAGGAGTRVDLVETTVAETHADASGAFGYGLDLQSGAELAASGARVSGNTHLGVLLSHAGTVDGFDDSVVEATRRGSQFGFAVGVGVQEGAVASFEGGGIEAVEGPGLFLGPGGTAAATGWRVEGNSFAGVVVLGGAFTGDGVDIAGTTSDAEWGGGMGVYAYDAYGPGALRLTRSTIGPHPYAGAWFDGDGAYVIEDSTISGSGGVELHGILLHGNAVFAERGVSAWNGERGLRLAGSTFEDAGTVAVLLDGASAELAGGTWRGNAVDVWQQGCDETIPLADEALDGVPAWERCPGTDRLVDYVLAFSTLYLPEANPKK